MENNDRQQEGVNFEEAKEDVFVDPFAGEAVSEDAWQGDWGGGLLNWDLPKEEQQQGFVKGEYDSGSAYDPGFVPEGEYTPGSEHDPGFVLEDKRDEEPVEAAPAVDPWDSTPLLDMVEQADAGESGIEVSGNEEIEMPPEYVGRAEAAGQKQPNDAPVFLGAPPPETVEQAGAADEEIEKPPEHVGRAGTVNAVDENDIEMLSDDAGQAGAGDGEIEMLPDDAGQAGADGGDGDGEVDAGAGDGGDLQDERSAELEARYGNVSDGNHPRFAFTSEEYLADYYKTLYKQLNGSDQEPDIAGLDTYERLRTGVYELWEQRDNIFEQHERDMDAYYREWFKKEFGYDLGEDVDWTEYSKYITGTKDVDEDVSTEATPEDAGQAEADAKVDENDIEMLPNDAGHEDTAEDVDDPYSHDDYFGW